MSYRNDHDAALARVDALEADYARVAAENAQLRARLATGEPRATRQPLATCEPRASAPLPTFDTSDVAPDRASAPDVIELGLCTTIGLALGSFLFALSIL
jgi:hypothetical protein